MQKKDIIVLGLGIFGAETAKELYKMGHSVLAVDRVKSVINSIVNDVTEAVVADSSDIEALKELEAGKFDIAVVSMSSSLEQMILTVSNLRKLGTKKIIAKADQKIHEEILLKIGADEVVMPNREMAKKTAEKITSPGILDVINVDSEIQLVSVIVNKRFDGKNLLEIDFRNRYGVSVIMIKKNGGRARLVTSPAVILNEGDELVVAGKEKDIIELFS